MSFTKKLRFAGASASALIALLGTTAALAQEAGTIETEPGVQEADDGGQQIVVTGNRFGGRVVTESPTPIDSISSEALVRGGATDLQGMLRVAVPSFNATRPVSAGVADFLQTPTLRGLPGQMLVLVNGKRRHYDAQINGGNQVGRGDIQYNWNAIPFEAISRVEVLRDGAAAQYGADAIAGVINIVTDEKTGYSGSARFGITEQGDGEDVQLALAAGVPLGEGGVVRVTGSYQKHWATDRALPDTRQQYFGRTATGAPTALSANYGSGTGLTPSSGTLDPREATIDRDMWVYGDPKYELKNVFVNAKLPIGGAEVYGFGSYSKLDGVAYNFFRRAGQDETVRSIHPDGFLPLQVIGLENFSVAAGIRGDSLAGFAWDLSSVYGGSSDELSYDQSNNVSLGANSPTFFYRGGYRFQQWTNNLDLSREIEVGDNAPFKLALGAEYRREWFAVREGDPSSYANGGATIIGGPNAGRPGPVGAQPSGGNSPDVALTRRRHSIGVYGELEKTFFDALLLTAAARWEDFSDFGDTFNYRFAGRLQVAPPIALRASYGTGFRAPALPQSFNSGSSIAFLNGQPVRTLTLAVDNPIAPLVGVTALRPEKSRNFSAGFVFDVPGVTFSMDYYHIAIKDRIVASSNFQSTALTNLLAARGFPGIAAVAFEANAVDSTNKGVDLALTVQQRVSPEAGTLRFTLAANVSEAELDRIAGTPSALVPLGITNPLFDLTQQVRFTKSVPRDKLMANLEWEIRRFAVNLTGTRYGSVSQVALTGRTQAQVAALIDGYDVEVVPANAAGTSFDIIQNFSPDWVADLELRYNLTDWLTLTGGVSNLFDQYPDRQIASTVRSVAAGTNGSDNAGIFPYAYIAPYGVNGRTFHTKLRFRF